jgi:hypothetical protein
VASTARSDRRDGPAARIHRCGARAGPLNLCYAQPMQRSMVATAIACALGVAVGCAGKRKGTQEPGACMRACEQEECAYKADPLGDNEVYYECLEVCEGKCSSSS